MKPSSRVIADPGRSSGKVIRQKRCHPLAPSIAAASKTSGEMLCRPLYMMTRLNGMPIQMFAISTATRDQQRQEPRHEEQRPQDAGETEPPEEENREGQADGELERDRGEDEDRGVDEGDGK